MISFEASKEGFILTVEGKRLLAHSSRSPCLWVARAVQQQRPKIQWSPATSFRLFYRGSDRIVIAFEEGLTLVLTYEQRVLRMRFEQGSHAEGLQGIKLKLGASFQEWISGGGARVSPVNLKGQCLRIANPHLDRPSFVTDAGLWMHIFKSGALSVTFGRAFWQIETEGLPEAISIGFAQGMEAALAAMSTEKGTRAALPTGLFSGAIIDSKAAGPARAAGLRTAAVGPEALSAELFTQLPLVPPAEHVPYILSHSLSAEGFAYIIADRAEALRLLETAAFGPVLRLECLSEEAKALSSGLLARILRASEYFAALEDYHRDSARAWETSGLPPLRHPLLHYPKENYYRTSRDCYMYGRDLFIAPPEQEGAGARSLVLPKDAWVHLWSGRLFSGGALTVDAPEGRPAVFYRQTSPFAAQFDALRRQAIRL